MTIRVLDMAGIQTIETDTGDKRDSMNIDYRGYIIRIFEFGTGVEGYTYTIVINSRHRKDGLPKIDKHVRESRIIEGLRRVCEYIDEVLDGQP